MTNFSDYEVVNYPLEVGFLDSVMFFIMQITPALSYNDLYNMPEDTLFAFYQLSKEKNDRELKEFNNKDKSSDFVGEEDKEAVDFFEEITGYND